MARNLFVTMDASRLGRHLRLLAYPRLRELPSAQWPEILGQARAAAFDLTERVAIVAGIALTTYLLQSLGDDTEGLLAHYLTQFVLALPLLSILVGPLLLRRTRRGLDLEMARRYGGDRCTSTARTPNRSQAQSEHGQ